MRWFWTWLVIVLVLGGVHWLSVGADGYALVESVLFPALPVISLTIAQKARREVGGSFWTFVRGVSIVWLVTALANLIPLGPPRQVTGKLVGHTMRLREGRRPLASNRIVVQTEARVYEGELSRVPGGLRLNAEVQVTLSRRLLGDKIIAVAPLP